MSDNIKNLENIFNKYFGKEEEYKVFHYTNKEAFRQIMKYNEIRVSNVCYFADRMEFDFSIRLARKILQEFCHKIKYYKEFYFFVEAQLLKFYIYRYDYYILSTCKREDNDYLKIKYGNNLVPIDTNDIYQVNFYTHSFEVNGKNEIFECHQGNVVYDEEKQNQIITEIYACLYNIWSNKKSRKEKEIDIGFLMLFFPRFLLMFKTDKYENEEEYRIIFDCIHESKGILKDDSRSYGYCKRTFDTIDELPIEIQRKFRDRRELFK